MLDGSVKVDGFDVDFEAAVFDPRGSSRLRGEVEDKFAATEQVIPDYLVRIARGTEKELVALPIFVTRGMVQRKFVMRRETSTPKDLKGRTIGMGRVFGATSVYLRGLLADHFGVQKDARWITAEPLTSDGAMGGEWAYTHQRGGMKASELIQRLSAGELDAVIYPGGAGGHWFNWVVEGGASRTPDPYGDLEQMVASSSNLCFPVGDVNPIWHAVIYPGGAGGHWFNWVVEGGASRTPDPYGDLEQMVASSYQSLLSGRRCRVPFGVV